MKWFKGVDSVVMGIIHALELHQVSLSDFDMGVFTDLSDHLDFMKLMKII